MALKFEVGRVLEYGEQFGVGHEHLLRVMHSHLEVVESLEELFLLPGLLGWGAHIRLEKDKD